MTVRCTEVINRLRSIEGQCGGRGRGKGEVDDEEEEGYREVVLDGDRGDSIVNPWLHGRLDNLCEGEGCA